MPITAPVVRTPTNINRLLANIVCDFPPRDTGELWPDDSPKISYGNITFRYQTADADGNAAGWTPEFSQAELTDQEVIDLITVMLSIVQRHAAEADLDVDLTPVPL